MIDWEEIPHSIQNIEVTAISLAPWTDSERLNVASIDPLATSMSAVGLLQPVAICLTNGLYQLIFGARRYYAARQLGWPTIPAIVWSVSQTEAARIALAENSQNKPLSLLAMSYAIYHATSRFGVDIQSLPLVIGKSNAFMERIIPMIHWPLDLQMMLMHNPWTIWCAEKIAQVQDDRVRGYLINAALAHSLTSHELEAIVRDGWKALEITREGQSQAGEMSQATQSLLPVSNQAEHAQNYVRMPDEPPGSEYSADLHSTLRECVSLVKRYRVPDSLDEQADLVKSVCNTMSHLMYIFLCTKPTIRNDRMVQKALDNAPSLPLEWLDEELS